MKMPARYVRKPPSKLKTSVDKTTAAETTVTQNTETTQNTASQTTAPKPTSTSEHTTTKPTTKPTSPTKSQTSAGPTKRPTDVNPTTATKSPSPKILYTRKRKSTFVVHDENIHTSPNTTSTAQSTPITAILISSFSPHTSKFSSHRPPPTITPLVVQYPLELDLLKGELQSFYNTEQPSERSFPSLPNFTLVFQISINIEGNREVWE